MPRTVNWSLFENCCLCGKRCGVNRLKGQTGSCGLDANLVVSSFTPHFGEEPVISGVKGSGTVFFSGCNLSCCFCQNHQISHGKCGTSYTTELAEKKIFELIKKKIHNINFVTPTPWIPYVLTIAEKLKKTGIITVYNTGGYDNPELLEKLDQVIDIYLPDMKYADDTLAQKYSGIENYSLINRKLVKQMAKSKKILLDENGLCRQGVIIRHLQLPGCLSDTLQIIDYIADHFADEVFFSLMSQYTPCYQAPFELQKKIAPEEYEQALERVLKRGLENVFIQDLTSSGEYVPDFSRQEPFIRANTPG